MKISEEFNATISLITTLSPFSSEVLVEDYSQKLYIFGFGRFGWEGCNLKKFTSDGT